VSRSIEQCIVLNNFNFYKSTDPEKNVGWGEIAEATGI
jgi:hypothetical protein